MRALVIALLLACAGPAVAVAPAGGQLQGSITQPAAAAAARGSCHGEAVTIRGTDQSDVLTGTSRRDVIAGGRRDDVIQGLGGRDLLCGGLGKDRMSGGPGVDRVFGGPDGVREIDAVFFVGDVVDGGPGSDLLVGGIGKGDDDLTYVDASARVDVDTRAGIAVTGAGTDRFRGFATIIGTAFDDRMIGVLTEQQQSDDEQLSFEGRGGNDVLRGTRIHADGGTGADVLRGRNTFLEGGDGNDRLTELSADGSLLDPGSGDDVVTGGSGGDSVRLNPDSVDDDGTDIVQTGDGGDRISNADVGDQINTGSGRDRISLDGGPATVVTGSDSDFVHVDLFDAACANPDGDVLRGGGGRDLIEYLGTCGTTVDDGVQVDLAAGTAQGAAGADTVVGFENVVGSFGADILMGTDGANRISGGSGDDELFGFAGDDVLAGDEGRDITHGGGGADTVAAREVDTIDTGVGDDLVALEGGPSTVQTGAGADRVEVRLKVRPCQLPPLNGDRLDAGPGIDLIDFHFTCRRGVQVSLIDGTTQGGAGNDTLIGFENVLGSPSSDSLTGDDGANGLDGGDGDDALFGLAGDDHLSGNAGNDSADGGDGLDTCQAERRRACE